jgi:DNA-binding NarL/FixJ family response regulator
MRERQRIRVVLCDDHDQFREGVTEMLSLAEDIEVVGEAADHDDAVAVVLECRPDVVLLDLEMPGIGADESMRRMLGLSPPPKVVILTMHDEPGMVRHFLRRGASAYIPKSAEMAELVCAVRDAARAEPGPTKDAPEAPPETGHGSQGCGHPPPPRTTGSRWTA